MLNKVILDFSQKKSLENDAAYPKMLYICSDKKKTT